MSSRREVLIRILRAITNEDVNWNKKPQIKMLKMVLFHAINENVAVLTEDEHLPSFLVPTPGDLTAQESSPPGICHPRQKKW